MSEVFKKKNDLPQPPPLPKPDQILEDLKAADFDDPVFFDSSDSINNSKTDDGFLIAKEFMVSTTKLRNLDSLLATQKFQLQGSYEELRLMSENIRQQATEALSNIY